MNVVADTFYLLCKKDGDGVSQAGQSICPIRSEKIVSAGAEGTDESEDTYFSLLDNPVIADCLNHLPDNYEYCYLNLPEVEEEKNPLNIDLL